MDRLRIMETFVRVVDAGSFSSAAIQMGLSNSMLTKHVMQLEKLVGARLLNRTTRHTSVTSIGRSYYNFCVRILDDVKAQDGLIANGQKEMSGELKVLVSKGFGSVYMADAASEFMRFHPKIEVSLTLLETSAIQAKYIIAEGHDVAIRLSRLQKSSSIMARRIGMERWVFCCTPTYLRGRKEPMTVSDLHQHKFLSLLREASDRYWEFAGADGHRERIHIHLKANSLMVVRQATLDGHGVALLPTYCVGRDLGRGTLQEVLQDVALPEQPIYALFPHRQMKPEKVSAFVDFMEERLKRSSLTRAKAN